MSRSVILLSFATLSLFASCVDLRLPSRVSQCEQNDSCADGTGGATGGKGGSTAGSSGSKSQSFDAGASEVPAGGRGGSGGTSTSTSTRTGGTSGGATAGATGGSTNTTGGSGGNGGTGGETTGGTSGGTSGTADAGTEPTPDAPNDKAVNNPDVALDTYVKPDRLPDTWITGPEVSPPDLGPDLSPDSSPDRQPDTAFDTPSCVQILKSNGYGFSSVDGGIKACSECKTSGGNSLETPCKAMIDCLVTAWVCSPRSASCWTNCRNTTPNADMVVDDCVNALVSKACP